MNIMESINIHVLAKFRRTVLSSGSPKISTVSNADHYFTVLRLK